MSVLWVTLTAALVSPFMMTPNQQILCLAAPGVQQEERKNDIDEWINRGIDLDAARRGLWYGTPGVRAGDDMLGPILNLIKRPSSLFDFRQRRSLSERDLDLAEFNRRYRMSEHGSVRPIAPPGGWESLTPRTIPGSCNSCESAADPPPDPSDSAPPLSRSR